MSTWVCSLGRELCHPVRMSTSPGQACLFIGWVCLLLFIYYYYLFIICPQLRVDTDWLLYLLSREGKKAGPEQEEEALSSPRTTSNLHKSSSHGSCCKTSITPRCIGASQGPILLVQRKKEGGDVLGGGMSWRAGIRAWRSRWWLLHQGCRGWESPARSGVG